MKTIITLIAAFLLVTVSANAQLVFPFGSADVQTVRADTGSYDTTFVTLWDNYTQVNVTLLNDSTAITLTARGDIRTGAMAVFVTERDTTDSGTGTGKLRFVGSNLYKSLDDTIPDNKHLLNVFMWDGSRFINLQTKQLD